jgi:hypothetical protein
MIAAAQASQGPTVPFTIFRSNVDRIRRDFSKIYPAVEADIRAGRLLIIEGP